MKEAEDNVYIDRIKKGDPASYGFLVDKYKDMAYTIALRILHNSGDAEDAAQESFVKAYQQIHRFEGKSKFSTWLYTIVYRTSVTKRQKSKAEVFSIHDHFSDTYMADDDQNQVERLQASDEQKFISQAIAKLPPVESLLITLFYMNENSIKEIMEITGLTESNVKVKLFRAKKILEEQLRFLL
ncbi:sigma-70 family RNA polymerase sigma factor [Emticicia sp. CRIBPO]|uniref:RNA polymerase sigma factor n=1 Tax=Emticicia sp. CRIBPO TaxID=2683258 RepID=UPI0014134412|nr:sigma-70 family RNA polymerase sigma factor [Emticicia sp. CRIBPO]NBA87894.1 sigma-70 family RNA polymerase sigma factor [Emticicia sp. CRIBPO]